MKATIQTVLQEGYPAYEQTHPLPEYVRNAAHKVTVCRTAVLGGHVQGCPNGHYQRNWYNSCKHRMYPLCAYTQVEGWLEKQTARLLNAPHFHVVFTIPEELHELWRFNRKLMANLLFKSAKETIFELLADEKYLGAKPGMIASLHTWSKKLMLHPHLHCLVTGGGIEVGQWVSSGKRYLLPFGVVRKLFRGKYLHHLRLALEREDLVLPEDMSLQRAKNLFNKLGRAKKWNVYLKETYASGEGVLTYLGRYMRGGPISNKRIYRVEDGKVTFNYGRERVQLMTLPMNTFIGRYLQHTPLPNFIMVRSYGLYHHNLKEQLALCRKLLGQGPVEVPEILDWQALWKDDWEGGAVDRCPVCGKPLVVLELIAPVKINALPENFSEPDETNYARAA